MPKTHHSRLGSSTETRTALADRDASARLLAVGRTDDPGALAPVLIDPSPDVARAAIGRLVFLQGPSAAPALRAQLLVADVSLVPDFAKALRDLKDREATGVALEGLVAHDPYTRRMAAAIALGILGDKRARPFLGRALEDPVAAVRKASLDALVRLGADRDAAERAVVLLADPNAFVRVAAVRLVAGSHPQPGQVLSAMAKDPDRDVRCELARHLGKLTNASAHRLLTDRDDGVRRQAVSRAGSQHAIELGRLLTGDRSAEVRRSCARALGAIGGTSAGEMLISGIEDRDGIVRSSVLHALERALGRTGAVSRLATELQSARAVRRRSALYALASINDHERMVLVWRLADDPDLDVRLAVVSTAQRFLAEPDPLLMYMRTDPSLEVRASAERRLAGRPNQPQSDPRAL